MNMKNLAIAGLAVAVGGIAVKVFVDKAADKAVKKVEPRLKRGEHISETEIEEITAESVKETAEGAAKVAAKGVKIVTAIGIEKIVCNYTMRFCPAASLPMTLVMLITSGVISGMLWDSATKYIDQSTQSMMDVTNIALERHKQRKEEKRGENRNGKVVFGSWRNQRQS